MTSKIYTSNIVKSIEDSVYKVLESSNLSKLIDKDVIIKPNILSYQLPPKITDPLVVIALVKYIREYFNNDINITIAEGCYGAGILMKDVYKKHRYDIIKKIFNVDLVDLNWAESSCVRNENAGFLKEFFKSDILNDKFFINVPAIKGHGLTKFTGALKNMFGIAPAYIYKQEGHANKYKLHKDIHQSIVDLSLYVKQDFILMDGSVGLLDHHIKGKPRNPPINKICASTDPVAIDSYSMKLLSDKLRWDDIEYMVKANGLIGTATNYEVTEC
jgi:uncharacterized protein (DUF362 family)